MKMAQSDSGYTEEEMANRSPIRHSYDTDLHDQESFELEDASQRRGLLSQTEDLEKQNVVEAVPATPTEGHEYTVTTQVKMACLGLYFLMNLGLTLYNKAVLGKFNFPWLLTAFHTSSAAMGCYTIMLLAPQHLKLSHVGKHEHLVLVAFSVLFTVNIAISNVSLAMVSVPFHQIVRSTTPVATILIYRWLGRSYSHMTYISLVPIVIGVGLSTYGDYYATVLGASLTFLGVLLAAIKTVATNKLLTGTAKLPALELLLRLSPLAALQSLLWAFATGELTHFATFISEGNLHPALVLALVGNGFLAFLLNVTSFQTNKLAGALTLSVCGNLKQLLTVLLGVVLFDVKVGLLNGVGMVANATSAAMVASEIFDARGIDTAALPGADVAFLPLIEARNRLFHFQRVGVALGSHDILFTFSALSKDFWRIVADMCKKHKRPPHSM